MALFDKSIAIDWSGAGTHDKPVDIAVAEMEAEMEAGGQPRVVADPAGRTSNKWTRNAKKHGV